MGASLDASAYEHSQAGACRGSCVRPFGNKGARNALALTVAAAERDPTRVATRVMAQTRAQAIPATEADEDVAIRGNLGWLMNHAGLVTRSRQPSVLRL
jgi:hypothetical protein